MLGSCAPVLTKNSYAQKVSTEEVVQKLVERITGITRQRDYENRDLLDEEDEM